MFAFDLKHSSGLLEVILHCLPCLKDCLLHLLPDPVLADVLHGEGGVLPQLLVLLLRLAPGQDAVHRHRHQLDLNLVIWGRVVL